MVAIRCVCGHGLILATDVVAVGCSKPDSTRLTVAELLEFARQHKRVDDRHQAIDAYRKALELDPTNDVAWGELAEVFDSLGRTADADAARRGAAKQRESTK